MFSFAASVDALSDDALEMDFATVKKQLLDTDVYQNESRYRKLYGRLEGVLGKILGRHQHLLLSAEGKHEVVDRALLFSGDRSDPSRSLRVPSNLKLAAIDDGLIFYASLLSYTGGFAKQVGTIESNPEFALKAANYLIDERDFELATFFKGFILKYGLKPFVLPELAEARLLLEHSAKLGLGPAVWELRHFDRYSREFGGFTPKVPRAF
jgi:hypothetical protein